MLSSQLDEAALDLADDLDSQATAHPESVLKLYKLGPEADVSTPHSLLTSSIPGALDRAMGDSPLPTTSSP